MARQDIYPGRAFIMDENSSSLPQDGRNEVDKPQYYEFNPYGKNDVLADWSRAVKIKGGWVCNRCGELDRKLLESHHIKPKDLFPALIYDLENGECLCLWCHATAHWSNEVLRDKILARYAVIMHLRLYPKKDEEIKQKVG